MYKAYRLRCDDVRKLPRYNDVPEAAAAVAPPFRRGFPFVNQIAVVFIPTR